MNYIKRRLIALLLVLGVVLLYSPGYINANAEDQGADADYVGSSVELTDIDHLRRGGYREYLEEYSDKDYPDLRIVARGSDYSLETDSNVSVKDYMGKDDVLFWDSQEGYVEWTVDVPESGLYNLGMVYCPIESRNIDIELRLYINREVPFRGSERFILYRTWQNETNDFRKDGRGNELRPRQIEVFEWRKSAVIDPEGLENDPFYFYFEEGENTIGFEIINEPLAIESLVLYQEERQDTYSEPEFEENPAIGVLNIYQGQHTHLKSSAMLYPTEERGNPAAMPSHPFLIRYNTVGRATFLQPGQWISWEFEIDQPGYYNIAFKVRQDAQRGMYSTRRIYINGEVPFEEMNKVEFPYSLNWYTQILGEEEPFLYYFDEGVHEIKMEVLTGDIAGPLRELEDILYELNVWYRKIVMITGSNPDSSRQIIDINRDYMLDRKIPGLIEGFEDISERLSRVKDTIDSISFEDGNTASFIDEIIYQVDYFIERPDLIPRRLDHYKGNISTLSYTILQMREQPLEIDYFILFTPDMAEELPKARARFFETVAFRARMFISSFVEDYSSIGEIYKQDPLNVWVSTGDVALTGTASGRDQAQVIKSLIDDLFVPESDIGVNLSLVDSGEALIQAVLARQGPDAALFIPRELPVNLAVRGALANLDEYDDFDEVIQRFHETAMIPYYFEGKAYALPETQNFDMLFIRTDIFDELGLEIPETWEDFYEVAATLYINNMMVGILENIRTFEMFIYQNNASFYNKNLTATAFDTPEALSAFRDWTGLYAKHSLPLIFDFFSRFRTGEMPMSVMPYIQVNWLTAAAPEIRNLWTIAPVPGKLHPDGTINNATTSTGTACIVIGNTGREDDGYEFIKWWTSDEVQGRFGNDIEQLMGPSARYPTANIAAFDNLPWTREHSESLKRQWERVIEVPQVPGNYYIFRNISFAFRAVVYNHDNERETLNRYNRRINKEIERKRIEFGLPTE